MLVVKLLLIFAIVQCSSLNIFLSKLDNLLDFCLMNQNSVDSGTVLGISFAKVILLKTDNEAEIQGLINKCESIVENYYLSTYTTSSRSDVIVKTIIRSSNHLLRFPLGHAANFKRRNAFKSLEEYLKLSNDVQNQPNGDQSDACLLETLKGCAISNECRRIENYRRKSFNYSLTHKLIFHLFNHLICKADNFDNISHKLCSDIYQELNFMVDKVSDVRELKDLMMEQIFLCGFSGFNDFLKNDWIKSIIMWQFNLGCFSYDNFNCSSHMTGVGAANLALFGAVLHEGNSVNFENNFQVKTKKF
ncbi:CLUMA_CG019285, isoform A [Clunio marinus]|uniref:CLUMA_CG019285, isoform A n=1 Tax=Clunio marinus TaxID=568069 RepID=A0A1J1J0U9_9DIPT|nr:CLUMA_CG019285, isoform A [Clunio marinus]